MNQETKLSETESMNWGFLKALHPEERDRYSIQQQQAVKRVQPYKICYRVLGADGNYHWWSEQATPVRREDGTVEDWIVTYTPQTQSNGAEDALRKSEQKLALHIQQTPLAVIEWKFAT